MIKLDFDEQWKPIVIAGKEFPHYSISNYGRLVSHLKKTVVNMTRGEKGRITSSSTSYVYDPFFTREIKLSHMRNKDGSVKSLYKKLHLPKDFFDGTYLEGVEYYQSSDNTIKYHATAHALVMAAFRPIEDYPPERLKHCWEDLHPDAKQWIKECVIINHIHHDPTQNWVCAEEPHPQDSLEYCTPGENSRKAKEFYGGNHSNKGKVVELKKETKPKNALALLLEKL
jgi:hypothetical protein